MKTVSLAAPVFPSDPSPVLLGAVDLPAAYAGGVNAHSPERALPLPAAHRDSLATALRAVPDPRAPNHVFPCASLLTLVALGLLAGRKQLAEIQRFGQFLTQAQRAQLGWPYKAGTRFRNRRPRRRGHRRPRPPAPKTLKKKAN